MEKRYAFKYHSYTSIDELPVDAARTLTAAIAATGLAYAPYSNLQVGAAALLEGDLPLQGTNRENAAFPSGICAERRVLVMAANQYPGTAVCILAFAYKSRTGIKDML
jgi:cytidine deaminase